MSLQIPLKALLVCIAGACLLTVGIMLIRDGHPGQGVASTLVAIANVLFLLT